MVKKEERYSSDIVYEGPIFKVDSRRVKLFDGSLAQRDVVTRGPAVGILPLVDEDHAVLVKQWREPVGDFVLEIPAGKVDARDHGDVKTACREAAVRELNEEIRVHPGKLEEFADGFEAVGFTDSKIALYVATELEHLDGSDQLPRDEGEFLDIITVSYDELTKMYEAGELNDLKTLVAYFHWTIRRMKNGQ
ncbi:NUDIX hydrolase [Fructobacillus papyrifericola]|uniref:NUDIX hydrolase n=1 Tax=Fructobacillus papyrifericola TaxID=2713172 RepID=A0ABS5QSE4_9LACO|nr:NUDIX hydrolase [Fructobacillus papyrifericola]MBS9336130.1 NUDIX hydrolase [Fructobacillus papyrifericola]